eukprot:TRINITY_DN27954_c0_g1_i1.p1 TRINITY_DN27954_c0_g1~~TRINITY_DN27954_c0_g1_i1.p1  ORF type:complete len:515 (-),score=98.78 TRINITY_DN27954_c0_g1_i1:58-1602(-)
MQWTMLPCYLHECCPRQANASSRSRLFLFTLLVCHLLSWRPLPTSLALVDVAAPNKALKSVGAERIQRDSGGSKRLPQWLTELEDIGLDVDTDVYSKFLISATESGNVHDAQLWISQLRQDGACLEQISDQVVEAINRSLEDSNLQAATDWVELGVKEGLRIDRHISHNFVGKLLNKKGIENTLKWMEGAKVNGSLWVTPRLADIMVRRSITTNLPFAENVSERLLALGVPLPAYSFGSLIFGALRIREFAAVERWFSRAVDGGHRPNTATLNTIIGEAAKARGLEYAEVWFDRACEAGIEPNEYTYHYMLQAATLDDDPNAPSRWYLRSIEAGMPQDIVTFNTLISGAARKGLTGLAVRWFSIMKAHVEPTLMTYNSLMFAATKGNDLAGLRYWFKEIENAGLQPDVVSWNTLMSATLTHGEKPWVEDLWWMMLKQGVHPDAHTLRILRWSFGSERMRELCSEAGLDAEDIFEDRRTAAAELPLAKQLQDDAEETELFKAPLDLLREMLRRFR